jgi:DNA-binding NarL/FixJ family response regulator
MGITMKSSEQSRPIRLVLYTDDSVLSLGALSLFSTMPQFRVLLAEPVLSDLVPFVEQADPDVVLVDLAPEMTLGLISTLKQAAPEARLVLWARSFSDELRYQARQLGVTAFLHRSLSREQFALSLSALAGGTESADSAAGPKPAHSTTVKLTKRESQLVTLLSQGLKNKEIAACIGITEGTVRIYLSKLFAKIGARDRFEVAVFGLKNEYCGQASWDGQGAFVTASDEGRARSVLKSLVLVEPQRRRGYARRAVGVSSVAE